MCRLLSKRTVLSVSCAARRPRGGPAAPRTGASWRRVANPAPGLFGLNAPRATTARLKGYPPRPAPVLGWQSVQEFGAGN